MRSPQPCVWNFEALNLIHMVYTLPEMYNHTKTSVSYLCQKSTISSISILPPPSMSS